MKELSIFVDESGDFGEYEKHSPYYITTMVFHDQAYSINDDVIRFNTELRNIGYNNPVIHTEPLIRKEEDYVHIAPNDRRRILTKLYFFAIKARISYMSFVIQKKDFKDVYTMEARIARDISVFLRDNLDFFQSFEKIILYYDNGQRELNRILNTVFATELNNYEVRKVFPWQYKLFQVADLICTLTLTEEKIKSGKLSSSEKCIFHSKKDFYKDFMNKLRKKRFEQ